jgi:transcriptional regulator with XRE-family HTH domain
MAPTGGYNRALADSRRARRLTQAQLAERVSVRLGVDPPLDGNYVSKLERGVHSWPNASYRRAFREELGTATDAELGFHCSRSAKERVANRAADGTGTEQAVNATQDTATSAALRWLVLPKPDCRPQANANAHVRDADVARLRIARVQLKRLDDTLGGGAAYPLAHAYVENEASPLLNGSYNSEVGVDLLAAVAELYLDLGWMAYDADQQNRARQHMLDSLGLSRTAHGRSTFGGRVLTALSHQALYLRRPREALDLVRAARAGTTELVTPSVTAMFAAMEACALAAVGDGKQCESSLATAETALAKRTDGGDPSWLDFDQGGLWGHAARAYRDLGRPRRARAFAEDAVMACRADHSRTRAQRNAILASALAKLGEFEEAAEVGRRVVTDAWQLRSCHVLRDVSELLGLLGAADGSSGFTEQACELLRAHRS